MQNGASTGGTALILNGGEFCLPGEYSKSGDIFGCHNWGLGCANGIWWVEARDAGKQPRSPQQRLIQPQMSLVPKLKSPADKAIQGNLSLPFVIF